MRRTVWLWLWLSACAPARSTGPKGVGARLVEGGGQALVVAPHAAAALYLRSPAHPTGKLMPPDAYLGELSLVSPDNSVHSLGRAVTNLTGNLAFSADGRKVAFLDNFSFAGHQGDLVLADLATGSLKPVAADVGYFGFAPQGSTLGYIASATGVLKVGPGDASDQVIEAQVATFEFLGDDVLYRLRSTAGGALRRAALGKAAAQTIAVKVGDYQVSPDGKSVAYSIANRDGTSDLHVTRWGAADRKLGEEVTSFHFSPDGKSIAYVAGLDPHKLLGDLFIAEVERDTAPQRLGKAAGTYRFSADGRLGFIHDYYEPTRAGKFSLWDPIHGTVLVADSARVFGFSPSGRSLGFLKRVFKPLYTEQLMLLPLGAPGAPLAEARLIGEGIYAFDFTPDEKAILYKADCTREGEACDLMSVPTDAPAMPLTDGGTGKNPLARKLVSGVDDYDFSPDGKWLWITFKEQIGHTVDLAVIPSQGESLPRYIDFKAEPGPRWTQAGKLTYLVDNPKRAGLYEADPALAQPLKLHGQ